MRLTIGSLVPTIALTGALLAPAAPAKPDNSESLGHLVEKIEQQPPDVVPEAEEPQRRIEDVKGRLRPPVKGVLVRRFGEKDADGNPSPGITLRTPPGAQVVAPFESTVIFAQPYRDYGQLLILSTGGGYHFVLAGMTKNYGVEGQKVLEGEPVGVMGVSGAEDRPELYFEIRKDGKAVDPLPWLTTVFMERMSR